MSTLRERFSFAIAVLLSIRPVTGLVTAGLKPGCLVGYSREGLPWVVPTIATGALLVLGWWWRSAPESIWQLLSWGALLGASSFAITPLSRAKGWSLPQWEALPLFAVSVALVVRAVIAMYSSLGVYRALGACIVAVVACAVVAPWVPPITGRWPWAVLGLCYGTLGAVIVVAAHVFRTTRSTPCQPPPC